MSYVYFPTALGDATGTAVPADLQNEIQSIFVRADSDMDDAITAYLQALPEDPGGAAATAAKHRAHIMTLLDPALAGDRRALQLARDEAARVVDMLRDTPDSTAVRVLETVIPEIANVDIKVGRWLRTTVLSTSDVAKNVLMDASAGVDPLLKAATVPLVALAVMAGFGFYLFYMPKKKAA